MERFRIEVELMHELLGRRCLDDSDHDMCRRNIIRVDEMSWLRGHRYQGHVVSPAAEYMFMAVGAASSMTADQPLETLEVQDLVIHKAITIDKDYSGKGILFELKCIK